MNNRLEEFVKGNKRQFEVNGPSDQLWEKISAGLDQQKPEKKSFKLYQWMSVAALVLATVSIFTLYQRSQNKPIKMADVNPAVGQKAVQFVSQIEEKKDSLAVFEKTDPALYGKFNQDLSQLAKDYEKLKKQLQDSPNKEFVVRAMMKNLELQSQVLSQQLMIFNQVNQYKKENII